MNRWTQLWEHLRRLLAYFSPEPSLLSPRYFARKQLALLAALLAVAAIAGAVVLKPSRRTKPDVWENLRQRVSQRAQVNLFEDFSQGLDAW